jgi:predicted PurR-regulated permease PerM
LRSSKLSTRELVAGLSVVAFALYMAGGLLTSIALGAIFAVLLSPIYQWLLRKRVPPVLSASLVMLGFLVVLVLPISLLLFFGASTALDQFYAMRAAAEGGSAMGSWTVWFEELRPVARLRGVMSDYFNVSEKQFTGAIRDFGASTSAWVGRLLAATFSSMPARLTALGVTLLSLFFFLIDGAGFGKFVRERSPFDSREMGFYIDRFKELCRSVVLASVVAAVAQSLVFTLSCWIAGVDQTLLIGFLVFVAAFIPLVGSVPVTVTTAGFVLLTGNLTAGVFLCVMAGIVALIDNLARPFVLKGASNLHPLLAFAGALGGLQTFGFAGVFLGPILVGLAAVWIKRVTA